MELNIPQKVIDICIEDLKKADPYPDDIYEKYLCSEGNGDYDRKRCNASMAKRTLQNEGINFDEFMKEYVNRE